MKTKKGSRGCLKCTKCGGNYVAINYLQRKKTYGCADYIHKQTTFKGVKVCPTCQKLLVLEKRIELVANP